MNDHQKFIKEAYNKLADDVDKETLRLLFEVEVALYLLWLDDKYGDPQMAYRLFRKEWAIGAKDGDEQYGCNRYYLKNATENLRQYRSQYLWAEDLKKYRTNEYAIFAFPSESSFTKREDNLATIVFPYAEREKAWIQFLETEHQFGQNEMAGKGLYKIVGHIKGNKVNGFVKLDESLACDDEISELKPHIWKPKPPIVFSMDEIRRQARDDKHRNVLRESKFRARNGDIFENTEKISIDGVANIVGMVGSGKSALMELMALSCVEKGLRMCIVLNKVCDVFELTKRMRNFGITCAPVIGKSPDGRNKHIKEMLEKDILNLSPDFSKYLTPICHMQNKIEGDKILRLGNEPCHSLEKAKKNDDDSENKSGKKKKNRKNFVCPDFWKCQGSLTKRECLTAPLVVTTIHAFLTFKVGVQNEPLHKMLARYFDLIAFDECDNVQSVIDEDAISSVSFNKYYIEPLSKIFENFNYLKPQSNIQKFVERMSINVSLRRAIFEAVDFSKNNKPWLPYDRSWRNATNLFSEMSLLTRMYENEKEISESLFTILGKYFKNSGEDEPLLNASAILNDECFIKLYNEWLEKHNFTIETAFPKIAFTPHVKKTPELKYNPSANNNPELEYRHKKLMSIIKIAALSKHCFLLAEAVESVSGELINNDDLKEVLAISGLQFEELRTLLPSATYGDIRGFRLLQDDIEVVKVYAHGRSMMKDFPYLWPDRNGRRSGAHVVMLSGTGWLPDSLTLYVNRPVDYLLETSPEKIEFIKGIEIIVPTPKESFEDVFVSGSLKNKQKTRKNLGLLIERWSDVIMAEASKRSMFVTNSYEQAIIVADELQKLTGSSKDLRVCIPENPYYAPSRGVSVLKGGIAKFAASDCNVLVTPMVITSRGYNIVDEIGHTAISNIFMLIRPMQNPIGFVNMYAKINGRGEQLLINARKPGMPVWKLHGEYELELKRDMQEIIGIKRIDALSAWLQRDLVSTQFNNILQLYGRLCRVNDFTRERAKMYFLDSAFLAKSDGGFSFLHTMEDYLDSVFANPATADLARHMCLPFYESFKRAMANVPRKLKKQNNETSENEDIHFEGVVNG